MLCCARLRSALTLASRLRSPFCLAKESLAFSSARGDSFLCAVNQVCWDKVSMCQGGWAWGSALVVYRVQTRTRKTRTRGYFCQTRETRESEASSTSLALDRNGVCDKTKKIQKKTKLAAIFLLPNSVECRFFAASNRQPEKNKNQNNRFRF